MKSKWRLLLVISLALLLASSFLSCASPAPNEENVLEEFYTSMDKYIGEFLLAEEIAVDSLNQQAELLTSGKLSTLEFGKRVYLIHLIHANTLKYINSKPEYAILQGVLWDINDGEAPKLGWYIPELANDKERAEYEYEQYLVDYVLLYELAIDRVVQRFTESESENP